MKTLTPETLETITAGLGQHAGYVPRNLGAASGNGVRNLWLQEPGMDILDEPGLPVDELYPHLAGAALVGAATVAGSTSSRKDDAGATVADESPADWWTHHAGAFGA